MIRQPQRVQLSILSSTSAGRWSVLLAIVSLIALAFFFLISHPDADAVTGALMLGSILTTAIAGIGGLIVALVAILRRNERGLLLGLPILWGLVVAFFTFGELAFPH